MDNLYNIKTYFDKLMLLEASEGNGKQMIANMWTIGMLDMKMSITANATHETYTLVFNLRKKHPLSRLFKKRLQDTYFLNVPHVYHIELENGKIKVGVS